MNRALASAILILALALVGGCSSAPGETGPAPSAGMMGGGEGGMPLGAVAASRNASIQVAPRAAAAGGLKVDRVLAPDDGWVVVRSTIAPGGVLGYARVARGENRDVKVTLAGADTVQVRVALHVDRGRRGEFEFDPEAPDRSSDRPVIVDRAPLESPVMLSDWGVEVLANSVLLKVEDQPVIAGGVFSIRYVILSAPGWISVNVVENGLPGRRVGLVARSEGEWYAVGVPLDRGAPAGPLVVTVFADRGEPARFDYDPGEPYVSADQPFVWSDLVVSSRVMYGVSRKPDF